MRYDIEKHYLSTKKLVEVGNKKEINLYISNLI